MDGEREFNECGGSEVHCRERDENRVAQQQQTHLTSTSMQHSPGKHVKIIRKGNMEDDKVDDDEGNDYRREEDLTKQSRAAAVGFSIKKVKISPFPQGKSLKMLK